MTQLARLCLLAALVHLASGAVSASGLLATADVFTGLLRAGPTPERMLGAAPALALVVLALAARAVLESGAEAVRGALTPRVLHEAESAVHGAVARVDLIAFDDADFRELVRQGGRQSSRAIESGVRGAGEVLSTLISFLTGAVTIGLLDPRLTPTVLLTACCEAWAAMRVAKLGYDHFLANATHQQREFDLRELEGMKVPHSCCRTSEPG